MVDRLMRRLRHRVGRRGAFLLFLAMLDLVYGYALIFPNAEARQGGSYTFLASVMPLWFWGELWLTIGLSCGFFAFRTKDAVGYAGAMFLKMLWAFLFMLGWTIAGVDRGYLVAAIWGAFACVVWLIATWPEYQPGEPPHEEGL